MKEAKQTDRYSSSGAPAEILEPLARAVEQSADLVMITDRQGTIEYVNPAFETLTGYSRDEAVGRHSRMLKSGQHDQEFYEHLWSTILSGEVFRGAIADRKKNGEIFFLEKTITPVRDAANEIVHFISNDRDVTDRKRLESQLLQVQRMDAIGAFAGGIAHDFNNLLMVISAYSELTLEALSSDHPLRGNVDEILQASRRATELTRQLLAFSRKPPNTIQLLDFNAVVGGLGHVLPRLAGNNVHLQVVLGPHLKSAMADPSQLEQIVLNLVGNARDAMPNGGELKIETSMVRVDESYVQQHASASPGEYVLLTIADSGEGIAPEHMSHIFEPFYTTKPSGKGTGLGLATTYNAVKHCGGFIWVYSERGLGTTFKLYFPCAKQTANGLVESAAITKGTETILLVEDDAAVRKSERDFLTASGYRVLEAANPESALEIAKLNAGAIHLMITDVILPNIAGPQLAEQVIAMNPQMKLLFVSGYAESNVLRRGLVKAQSNFLEKPFSGKMLAEKIRQIVGPAQKAMAASG